MIDSKTPDMQVIGEKAEVMRKWREGHPDATIDEVMSHSRNLDRATVAYHYRMITELEELEARINKLDEFTRSEKFLTLGERGQDLMRKQLDAMELYADILAQRVALL